MLLTLYFSIIFWCILYESTDINWNNYTYIYKVHYNMTYHMKVNHARCKTLWNPLFLLLKNMSQTNAFQPGRFNQKLRTKQVVIACLLVIKRHFILVIRKGSYSNLLYKYYLCICVNRDQFYILAGHADLPNLFQRLYNSYKDD